MKIQQINETTFRTYNPEKLKPKRFEECNPSVVFNNTLMTWDNEFIISKDQIDNECKCPRINFCKQIIDLLLADKMVEAVKLLEKHEK